MPESTNITEVGKNSLIFVSKNYCICIYYTCKITKLTILSSQSRKAVQHYTFKVWWVGNAINIWLQIYCRIQQRKKLNIGYTCQSYEQKHSAQKSRFNSQCNQYFIYCYLCLRLLSINKIYYPCDAMLARVFGTATCPSVCHVPVLHQNEEITASTS